MEKLQEEAKTRSGKERKTLKKCRKDLIDVMIVNDHEEQEDDGEEEISEEGDDTVCNICGTLWKKYTKGIWLISNIYDDYVCRKCVSVDTDLGDDFIAPNVKPNI